MSGAADTFQQPAYPTDNGSGYPLNLDASIKVLANAAAVFAPHAVPASPPTPTLSQVAGGALGATTYYVKTTYATALGEVVPSAEASLAVSANNLLKVTAPAQSGNVRGVTGWNVYVSTSTGTETKQNGGTPIALGTDWTEPGSGLVSGSALPAGLSKMSIIVDPGTVLQANASVVSQVAQQSSVFTAPVSNPRIDRVVLDIVTGAISTVAGTEAASPTAPAITAGKLPCAQVALTVGMTQLGNSNLTDERTFLAGAIIASIITAAGDTLYGTAANRVGRLAIGTPGQVYRVNSGATAPEWGTSDSPVALPVALTLANQAVFSMPGF